MGGGGVEFDVIYGRLLGNSRGPLKPFVITVKIYVAFDIIFFVIGVITVLVIAEIHSFRNRATHKMTKPSNQ